MYEYFSYLIGIPLALIYKKVSSFDSRVIKIETIQKSNKEQIDKMCKSNEDLTKKVYLLIGKIDAKF